MKIANLLSVCFILLFCTLQLNAQLYVDSNGNVSMGTNNPGIAKLRLQTINERIGLSLTNNALESTGSAKYGIYSSVGSLGEGEKRGIYNTVTQNSTSSQRSFGLMNYLTPLGSGDATGIYNYVFQGLNKKTGFENLVYQSATSNNVIGIRNTVNGGGTGDTYGLYNYLKKRDNTGLIYGIYSKVLDNSTAHSGNMYNLFGKSTQEGSNIAYNVYSYLTSNGANTGTSYSIYSRVSGTSSKTRYGLYSSISGGPGFAGYFVGNVHINGVLTEISDERLKENIEELEDAMDIVQKLTAKSYNYKNLKNQGNDPTQLRFGFLAQDMEKVLPNLVEDIEHPGEIEADNAPTSSDDPSFEKLDEHGNPLPADRQTEDGISRQTASTSYKAINYTGLIPVLTQAIKEQNDAFAALEKEQEDLAQNNEELLAAIAELRTEIKRLKECVSCDKILKQTPSTGFNIDDTFKVFPNPTDSYFVLENTKGADYTVNIFDGTGKVVLSEKQSGTSNKINAAEWPAGTYYLSVRQEGQVTFKEQIVIIH